MQRGKEKDEILMPDVRTAYEDRRTDRKVKENICTVKDVGKREKKTCIDR